MGVYDCWTILTIEESDTSGTLNITRTIIEESPYPPGPLELGMGAEGLVSMRGHLVQGVSSRNNFFEPELEQSSKPDLCPSRSRA